MLLGTKYQIDKCITFSYIFLSSEKCKNLHKLYAIDVYKTHILDNLRCNNKVQFDFLTAVTTNNKFKLKI